MNEPRGDQWIAGEPVRGTGPAVTAVDPRTGHPLDPSFPDASPEQVDAAARAAGSAVAELAGMPGERRARLLEAVAAAIEDLGDDLLARAEAETALPRARLENERGRTVGQLRMFAELAREGSWVDARIDCGDPGREPRAKPDVRRMLRPLGPVAVFGASNFPLAFSVAGGDTASALAAGCPVVAKGHPAHPGTSELVAAAVARAVDEAGLPGGTFSMVHGAAPEVGAALVAHPAVRALAYTGSATGGRALAEVAAHRPDPIPVCAEMGSTNPVFLLPGAVRERRQDLAAGLAQSVTLGVGQFCTCPGLVFAVDDDATGALATDLAGALQDGGGTMLHAGLAGSYRAGVEGLVAIPGVEALGAAPSEGPAGAGAALLRCTSAVFRAHDRLAEEVFGPATVLVTCTDLDDLVATARGLEGQLTASVHATPGDLAGAGDLLAVLERKAGRLVFDGYPTGVEVGPAMHHGGPWPATTDARFTSVGTAAVLRFARPVCWQDAPADVLPPELRDGNPLGLWRLVDGVPGRE